MTVFLKVSETFKAQPKLLIQNHGRAWRLVTLKLLKLHEPLHGAWLTGDTLVYFNRFHKNIISLILLMLVFWHIFKKIQFKYCRLVRDSCFPCYDIIKLLGSKKFQDLWDLFKISLYFSALWGILNLQTSRFKQHGILYVELKWFELHIQCTLWLVC